MIRSFNDKPRPDAEKSLPTDWAHVFTFLEADRAWLEAEIDHMKLVMEAACSEIEDEDYYSAMKMLQHAIERPL